MATDPTPLSCLTLLRRFADGKDQDAFAEIVQGQAGWMRGTALRMTGDEAAADEILQDAFALLARNLPRCESDAALMAWLHRTVVFTARNHLAKERRRARKLTNYQMEQPTGESGDQEDALRDLDAIIAQLPERDRQFIVARYMTSLAWEEMGTTFGCSAEAVRKRVGRILERMGSVLRNRGIALPAGALLGIVAGESCAAIPASQAIALAAAAVAKSTNLSFLTLASHALVTMKASQVVLSVAATCTLLVAIPVALSSSEPKSSTPPTPSARATTAATEPGEDRATRLALAAHAKADAIAKLPRFSYQVRTRHGIVDSLRAVDVTLDTLKRALVEPVREQDWLDYERGFSWDEQRLINEQRPGKSILAFNFAFGTATDAWMRSESQDHTSKNFVRSATIRGLWNYPEHMMRTWITLFDLGGYLRLTPHRFWWGQTVSVGNAHTVFSQLDEVTWKILGQESFGEEPCDLLEATYKKDGEKAERLWVSQKTGLARGVVSYNAKSEPNEFIRFDDFREVAPGIWVPFREVGTFPHASAINPRMHQLLRNEVFVEEARPGRDLSARYAELLPKDGDQVQDQRFASAVNLRHSATRTDDEIQQQAEAQWKKEQQGFEEVRRRVKPLEEMIGKPASALPTEGWLNGHRPEVAGKPYLIHFWATWCGPCKHDLPLLKMLSGQGLAVVGIHPPGTPADEIEKFTREQGLNYPTLLADAQKGHPPQPKIGGYPVELFPYCVLVDASGLVATHGSLSNVNQAASTALFVSKMAAQPTPALQASRWLNTAAPFPLDSLKGKTVLLDFWGQWCNPCVKNLPHCEELHTKFKDRGLVVIGVHTPNDSEKLDAFLNEKKVTFPVMIDQGETADRFQVRSWPTYVLIDKTGKIAWGFTNEPPSAAQIERLIAAKE